MSSTSHPTWSAPLAAEGAREVGRIALTSPAMGCGLLAVLVFVNEAVLRTASVERFSFDAQMALRLGVCGLCGLYGLALLPRTWAMIERFPYAWALLLWAWSVVTVAFATNIVYSLGAVASLACVLLFAPALLAQATPRAIVTAIVASLACYIVAGWIAYVAWPALSRMESVSPDGQVTQRLGGLGHPNALGRQCALLLALLVVMRQSWQFRWSIIAPLTALALVTLWRTDSRTAMAAAAAAAGVLWAQRYVPWWRGVVLLAAVVGVMAGAALLLLGNGSVELDEFASGLSRTGEAEEIYNLTGRTDLWQFALDQIASSPFFGYGWGSARFVMVDGHFATHHAHNLLLNVMLGGGVVAGLLLAAMLLGQLRRLFVNPAAFPDAITVLVCVGGLADYVMLNPIPDSHTALWFLALGWRTAEEGVGDQGSETEG